MINAASYTPFTLAVGGHRLTITHADGFPVAPQETTALHIGQGERYDLLLTLGDGVFPLVAKPDLRTGRAMAVIRTSPGSAPAEDTDVAELAGPALQGTNLSPAGATGLRARPQESAVSLRLEGQTLPYAWAITDASSRRTTPITVTEGQRMQLTVTNTTATAHTLHIDGHPVALASGLRKDTVLIPAGTTIPVQLDATNPGTWNVHCQNPYHAAAGMRTSLEYK